MNRYRILGALLSSDLESNWLAKTLKEYALVAVDTCIHMDVRTHVSLSQKTGNFDYDDQGSDTRLAVTC